MEVRANYIFVGIFSLFSLMAGFMFIWWIGDFENRRAVDVLDVRIRGSVSGLSVGSAVHFNGIKVGLVEDVRLDSETPTDVIVRVVFTEDVPIRADTQASIGTLGLTGRAYIRLEGGSFDGERIMESDDIAMLEGSPATLDNVLARFSSIATRGDNIVSSLETLVSENTPLITSTVSNIETFSRALSKNSDGIDKLLSGTTSIASSISDLAERLEATIVRVESIVHAIDPEKVSGGVDDLTASLSSVRDFTESLDAVEFSILVSDLRTASESISALFSSLDPSELSSMIDSLSTTATMAERVSTTIASRTDELDSIIVDADAFITDMRATASSLNLFIEDLGSTIGGEDSQGIFSSAQRTLDRLDRVLLNLEENPESLIFGSSPSIPESSILE